LREHYDLDDVAMLEILEVIGFMSEANVLNHGLMR